MAKLSDMIENFIKQMLEENDNNYIIIQRNELANYFRCAPSQINYVLETRFTYERGYYIESKRGGGGYVRIFKAGVDEDHYLSQMLSRKMGDSMGQQVAYAYIDGLLEQNILDEKTHNILKNIVSDKTLNIQLPLRDEVRANIVKSIFLTLIKFCHE
ncbi:MAG: CtsR family transcriptional regulator [Thermoanaerobacteraceae bacterium]|nr:CtsR family transcriptional regulator [Thermoanaerobacteraceae bacterium]